MNTSQSLYSEIRFIFNIEIIKMQVASTAVIFINYRDAFCQHLKLAFCTTKNSDLHCYLIWDFSYYFQAINLHIWTPSDPTSGCHSCFSIDQWHALSQQVINLLVTIWAAPALGNCLLKNYSIYSLEDNKTREEVK